MAKKKPTVEEELDVVETSKEIRDRIQKEIESELGAGSFISGSEIIERPRSVISVSPAIDPILGGGVPEGSWFLLVGKYKSGKSTTAYHFAGNCQKEENGARNVYVLNVEGRLKKRDLEGIPHLNVAELRIIESTPGKILSGQDYLKAAEKILMTDPGCVLIIDSISALCEERQMVGGIGTQTRGGGAALIAQFTNQMANVVNVNKCIVVCIMQVMSNTSGYGANTTEKGGNAIQYQADVKLRVDSFVPWALTQGGEPFGQIVTWKAHVTAIGPPGRSCESYIRYGEGIDEATELIVSANDFGLISGKGWLTLDYMKGHMDKIGLKESDWKEDDLTRLGLKLNGKDKVRKALITNPILMQCLKAELEV